MTKDGGNGVAAKSRNGAVQKNGTGKNANHLVATGISCSAIEGISNVHDSLKALEEMRLDAEKGMFMFDGAIQLLLKQQEDSLSSGSCAVCRRQLSSKKLLHHCAKLLQAKRETVLRLRNEEAASLHDSCIAAMKEILHQDQDVPTPNSPRLAFYLRTGELSEWRQQKVDCMTNMGCFACNRSFTREEFASFLRRVDHRAAAMERELHMHPKFCTIATVMHVKVDKLAEVSVSMEKRARWANDDAKDEPTSELTALVMNE